jgi:hypothetical protein
MALLARSISNNHGIPVVTDDLAHDLILRADEFLGSEPVTKGYGRREAPREQEELSTLCTLVFDTMGVTDWSALDIRKIVRFREKYDSERQAFVDQLQYIVAQLQNRTFGDGENIDYWLREEGNKLSRRRSEFAKATRSAGIENTLKLGAVTIPMAAALFGSAPAFASAAASALGVGALLQGSFRARRTERGKDPSSFYLFRMSEELDKKAYLEALSREVRLRFRHDTTLS